VLWEGLHETTSCSPTVWLTEDILEGGVLTKTIGILLQEHTSEISMDVCTCTQFWLPNKSSKRYFFSCEAIFPWSIACYSSNSANQQMDSWKGTEEHTQDQHHWSGPCYLVCPKLDLVKQNRLDGELWLHVYQMTCTMSSSSCVVALTKGWKTHLTNWT